MTHCALALAAVPMMLLSACAGQSPTTLGGLVGRANGLAGDKAIEQPSDEEATGGLKDALVAGITHGADLASQVDGYYGNLELKIPFPQDFQYVADKVRQVGLGHLVDDFIRQLNRGAERAASKAAPIFKNAITSLTVADVWGILRGGDNAATLYLERTTSVQLQAEFRPIIEVALDEVEATKHYQRIIAAYNRIPLTRDVNPDLGEYATAKAMSGLFVLVAQQEVTIRQDPAARTTGLLQKVFSYLHQQA